MKGIEALISELLVSVNISMSEEQDVHLCTEDSPPPTSYPIICPLCRSHSVPHLLIARRHVWCVRV